MLAEVAARLGRYPDAENAAGALSGARARFHGARHNYAVALYPPGQARRGAAAGGAPAGDEPRNPSYRSLHAAVLAGIGEYARAHRRSMREVLRAVSRATRKVWMSYGHALKTAGRSGPRASTPTATRIELEPCLGEVWWSLANLKTFRFAAADIWRHARAAGAQRSSTPRTACTFTSPSARRSRTAGEYAGRSSHYREGNTPAAHADVTTTRERTARPRRAHPAPCSRREFFARARRQRRAGRRSDLHRRPAARRLDADRADPGEPLAGRGHHGAARTYPRSRTRSVRSRRASRQAPLPAARCRSCRPHELRELGEEYLARTRIQRKTGRAVLHRQDAEQLPARRLHPSDAAQRADHRRAPPPARLLLLGFKQHFARGQNFTYDLAELGATTADYVELMAHFERCCRAASTACSTRTWSQDTEARGAPPARVLRPAVRGGSACASTRTSARCAPPAPSRCAQPIYREGVDQWRHFEPWLGTAEDRAGPVLEHYPRRTGFRQRTATVS